MKHDTSFGRIIFISVFCLIVFPFAYQTILQYRATQVQTENFEVFEIVNEYFAVKNHLSTFVSEQGDWPSSLDEAGYFGREQLIKYNLSVPWTLKGVTNDKVLNKDLKGKYILINLHPNTYRWDCAQLDTDLPRRLFPVNCGGINDGYGTLSLKTWLLLVAFTSVVIIVLLAIFRHPLLKLIRRNKFSLAGIKFHQLKQLNLLAKLTGHRQPVLKANSLTFSDWQQLIQAHGSKPNAIFKLLIQTLPVESVKTEGKVNCRFMLSDQLELNLETLLIVVSDEVKSTRIINHINQMDDQATPLLLWLNNPDAYLDVQLQRNRINRPCLIPSQQQMTQLMVFEYAKATLVSLASKQLPINTISPYQGKGGITKSSHFFGRQAILDKLENQSQTNFFLVGGRQLGKTSLLKALYRKLKQQANSYCLYISLSDDRLLPRLSYNSGINQYTDLSDLVTQIQNMHKGKKIRLLIDEADLFVESEIVGGFELMNQFRQFAEQGQCQFIFAGFWQLYATAVLDYHSPLRNLAETITVGSLEPKAAYQLITEPMAMLRQKYESPELVKDIYQKTGGRANLINLICEYVVEQLAIERKVIDQALLEHAYQSDRVIDALLGWSNLSADPQACGLDRVIVYLVFIHQKVDLETINQVLDTYAIVLNPEFLMQSLQRLRLAHVLTKSNKHYQFAVPLFANLHDSNEAQVLIKQEVQYFNS